ncbi:TerB family tellurite resistance protein [Porticoccaceae bacterium]|nr:TerB family tellurite resistance protein [Porticoccaceae bacterium]MDA8788680.1 TerB family tellurite resistance protein [Porticoccaceae bacterium]MDB2343565.1 TerB family tellurite resistance protein [Porticoccaceae bacterium]MDB2635394.1 TerB family tellurite resistance protein [Porticoccaceae bacterium]
MIEKIKNLFSKKVLEAEADSTSAEQLATAALLIEVMVIDGNLDPDETQSIAVTLSRMLDLSAQQVDELIELSQAEVREATSLYQFTSEINKHFDHNKKLSLMTAMWRVAFADGHLDKHEESIIRRVADLLHIRHSEYIRCKQLAREK